MPEITAAKLFTMKPHPYAEMFPSAHGKPYDYLLNSVRRLKRLRNAVVVYEGKILDGRQRIRACREARVEPWFKEFTGTDAEALEMVWDLNFARRQLTPSMMAACIAKYTLFYEQGDRTDLRTGAQVTGDLAEKAGVSRRTVVNAKKVLRDGTEEEKEALETGKAKAKPLAAAIKKREAATPEGEPLDKAGIKIPPAGIPYWNRIPEAKAIMSQLRQMKKTINALLPDDPMWSEVNLNGMLGDLEGAINRFRSAIPEYVCSYCKGKKSDACTCCKGKTVISQHLWSFVPPEMKK